MYGRYTKDLGDFVREEAKRMRKEGMDKPPNDLNRYRGKVHNECVSGLQNGLETHSGENRRRLDIFSDSWDTYGCSVFSHGFRNRDL
ncbi:hypothetical protein Anas_03523 [Armadillidium nasatum]|uniref:Uncharacterized protein n=1 Tax=Armadillidium nasatum TaxID=96803 RepID=A0A5N5SW04_9CRUS|nr:hypothetical protein Anas_03523 [Armadillidium nasatum]